MHPQSAELRGFQLCGTFHFLRFCSHWSFLWIRGFGQQRLVTLIHQKIVSKPSCWSSVHSLSYSVAPVKCLLSNPPARRVSEESIGESGTLDLAQLGDLAWMVVGAKMSARMVSMLERSKAADELGTPRTPAQEAM